MNSNLSRAALRVHERFTGRHILERLNALNRTQWLNRDELLTLQQAKLKRVLEYAYQYVPYYRRTFDQAGFQPGDINQGISELRKLPVLTKKIIRENWNDLKTTEPVRRNSLTELCTSGSTGEPLVFMQDRDFRDAVTADIQRHLGWAGCGLGDLHALIWCAAANPSLRWKIRTGLIDSVWNRFRLNAYTMTEKNMAAFAEQVLLQKPKVLFGFANDLQQFARFISSSRYQGITFNGIFSTAEVMLPPVRQSIEDAFHCKVYDRYGTFELGGVGCECEVHTGYHISMENNYVEILANGSPAGPGTVGDLVVTNLNNLGMPFIRYNIGDASAWSEEDHCSCGRASPKIKTIEGRIRDALKTSDGRTIYTGFSGHAFLCLAHPEISQFQVVQKTVDRMVVRLVPGAKIPQSTLDEISHAFQGTFGKNVDVDFEIVEQIPQLPSGKHQYVVSEINISS